MTRSTQEELIITTIHYSAGATPSGFVSDWILSNVFRSGILGCKRGADPKYRPSACSGYMACHLRLTVVDPRGDRRYRRGRPRLPSPTATGASRCATSDPDAILVVPTSSLHTTSESDSESEIVTLIVCRLHRPGAPLAVLAQSSATSIVHSRDEYLDLRVPRAKPNFSSKVGLGLLPGSLAQAHWHAQRWCVCDCARRARATGSPQDTWSRTRG